MTVNKDSDALILECWEFSNERSTVFYQRNITCSYETEYLLATSLSVPVLKTDNFQNANFVVTGDNQGSRVLWQPPVPQVTTKLTS